MPALGPRGRCAGWGDTGHAVLPHGGPLGNRSNPCHVSLHVLPGAVGLSWGPGVQDEGTGRTQSCPIELLPHEELLGGKEFQEGPSEALEHRATSGNLDKSSQGAQDLAVLQDGVLPGEAGGTGEEGADM